MGTWSLISNCETLKHHQSGVDGDLVMEGLGERGSAGQKPEAHHIAYHKFLSIYERIFKNYKSFRLFSFVRLRS